MASTSHGSDTVRLREVGRQLTASSDRLADVATTGRGMAQLLVEHWSGADLDAFATQAWPEAEQRVHAGSQMMRAMGEAAIHHAEEQETASEGGGGHGAESRGRGDGGAGDNYDAEQTRDPDEYGDLPPEVREKWDSYDEREKRLIIREIIRERTEHYGLDTPSVIIDDSIDGNGVWRERQWPMHDTVVINEKVLEDPMILHTVFHEMRHAAQHEAVRDANPLWPWQDPEYDHGLTPEEVQEWKENNDDYKPAPTQEEWDEDPEAAQRKYDEYFDQPVEVDAREEGSQGVEGMTPDELDRLLDEAEDRVEASRYDGPNPDFPH